MAAILHMPMAWRMILEEGCLQHGEEGWIVSHCTCFGAYTQTAEHVHVRRLVKRKLMCKHSCERVLMVYAAGHRASQTLPSRRSRSTVLTRPALFP